MYYCGRVAKPPHEPTLGSKSRDESGSVTRRFNEARPDEQTGVERRAGLGDVLSAVLGHDDASVTLGRFELRQPLGRGAMGIVYRAWDPKLEREIAVKVLTRDRSRSRLDAILEEARMLARVSDPHVVTVHEADEADGEAFIAMEFVDGCSLETWLDEHPDASREEISAWFRQAGRGLAAAHRAGVIHRDFKPGNVLVGKDGRVRVIDFGLALPDQVDAAGEVAGTWRYMAPEQRRGDPVDARSDQFAYCVALWTALDPGSEPGGEATSLAPRLRSALSRGMSDQPDDRFADMQSLLAALFPEPRLAASTWAVGGVLSAALAGAVVFAMWPQPEIIRPSLAQLCPDARPRLDDAWGETRRQAVAAAFERPGHTPQQTGFAHLATRIDAFADGWTSAYDDACRDSVAGTVEEVTRGRSRMTCLDAAADDLAWLTSRIPKLDAADRDRLPLAMLSLRTPRDCLDDAQFAAAPAEQQDLVRQIYRAEAAIALKDNAQARQVLEATLFEATSRKLDRIAARCALDLSVVAFSGGDMPESRRWADDALAAGERAADVELMALSWLRRGVAARESKDFEAAAFALDRANNLRARLPEDSAVDGQIKWDEASLVYDRGEMEQALTAYQDAVELLANAGEVSSAALAQCDAVNPLLELGRLDDAAAASDGCVGRLVDVYGPQHPRLAFPLAQATNLYLVTGENARAMEFGERAVQVWGLGSEVSPEQRAQVFALVAGVAGELERYDRADQLLEEARAILAEMTGPPSIAYVIVNAQYAVSLTERGRCDEAMRYYDETVETFAERDDAPADQLAVNYLNRAECLAKLGRRDDALESLAAGWKLSPHEPTSPIYLQSLRHDGEIRRLAGDVRGAERSLTRVLASAESRGMSKADIAYTRFVLAQTLADKGDREGARAQIALARPLFDAAGGENPKRHRAFVEWVEHYTGEKIGPVAIRG